MKVISKGTVWVLLAGVLLVGGCRKENTRVVLSPPLVTVALPVEQEVTEYAYFTGTTQARACIEIRARVEGNLESVHFRDGQRVKKGDLLFVIDPRPFRARQAKAQADRELHLAELQLARTTLERKRMAFKDKAVSEVAVIEAFARFDSARAAIGACDAVLDLARLDFAYSRIHAPMNGRISQSLVDVGNLVGAGERTLLANLIEDDTMFVYLNVSETELFGRLACAGGLALGEPCDGVPVHLTLGNGEAYPHAGRLDYVDNRVDAATGTIQVRGVFPNPGHSLFSGLFVHLKIPMGGPLKALLVPEHALGVDQQGSFVLVANENDRVECRHVTLGSRVNDCRVIKKGIQKRDRVIVNGIQRARPGSLVTPDETDARKTAKSHAPEKGKSHV
jgi:RND family efflux transporter MFP subunit